MIILPTSPQPSNVQPSLNDFGGFNEPPLGGAVQRIERMGNRFSAVVTMPAMSATNVRAWITDLLRGKSEGVRIRFPQLGVVVGALIMGVMNNGMSILGIGIDYQQVIKGLVLLAAVIFDVYNKSK